MKGLILNPEAQAELDAAAAWYEQQRPGFGAAFLTRVEEGFVAIQRSPAAFSCFKNTIVRKYVLKQFPYVIFYQELHAHLWVLAVTHAKRNPGHWLRRADDEETLGE